MFGFTRDDSTKDDSTKKPTVGTQEISHGFCFCCCWIKFVESITDTRIRNDLDPMSR